MDPLTALLGFATEISIRHVLVLNLVGYMIKCVLTHRGLEEWTDVIPFILGGLGVFVAYVEVTAEGNFIILGLANAGLAWLLHQTIKRGGVAWKHFKDKHDAGTRHK